MKGRQYLDDKDEITRIKKKKAAKKPNSKKSDHKHEYKETRVIKDSFANLRWEKVYLECVICGRTKEETRYDAP